MAAVASSSLINERIADNFCEFCMEIEKYKEIPDYLVCGRRRRRSRSRGSVGCIRVHASLAHASRELLLRRQHLDMILQHEQDGFGPRDFVTEKSFG